MAEFTKLSDVTLVAEPMETANVIIEENGVIKKAPKTAVGGGKSEWDAVIEYCNNNDEFYIKLLSGDYQTIYNKVMVEKEVPKVKVISSYESYGPNNTVVSADVMLRNNNNSILIRFPYYHDQNSRMSLELFSDNTISD